MGIQFFEEISPTSGDIPFVKEFLIENPHQNGNQFKINEIKLVSSNKGYLCSTDYFLIFLWKRAITTKMLIEALETYVKESYGYGIVAVLDKNHKDSFRLGVDADMPCMWYAQGKKFTTTLDIPSFDIETMNPFLIPHAPSLPTTPAQEKNGRVKERSQKEIGKPI